MEAAETKDAVGPRRSPLMIRNTYIYAGPKFMVALVTATAFLRSTVQRIQRSTVVTLFAFNDLHHMMASQASKTSARCALNQRVAPCHYLCLPGSIDKRATTMPL